MRTVTLSIEEWLVLVGEGKYLPVTTVLQGVSMEPLIRKGKDKVQILPVTKPLQIGDIVLFRRKDGAFVLHRLYKIGEGNRVQTWGDNCVFPDVEISADDVLGVAHTVEKRGRVFALDTETQRKKGIRWMNSTKRRKIWFFCRTQRSRAGRVWRWMKRQENEQSYR